MPRIMTPPQIVSFSHRHAARRVWMDALGGVIREGLSAPVSTRIALCVLDLCKMSADLRDLSDAESAKEYRKINWLIKLLKHSGGVPETAQLQTPHLDLSIHCTSGQARCIIVGGSFKGRSPISLSDKEMGIFRQVSGSKAAEVAKSYRALCNVQRQAESSV